MDSNPVWDFTAQPNKWGYLNNRRWSDRSDAQAFCATPQINLELDKDDAHIPCGHWHIPPPAATPPTYDTLFTSRIQVLDLALDATSTYLYASTGSFGTYPAWNAYNSWDAGYYWAQPYLARVSVENIINGPDTYPYMDIDPTAYVHTAAMSGRWDSLLGSSQQLSMCVLDSDGTKAYVCTGVDGDGTIKLRAIDVATMTQLYEKNYTTSYGYTIYQWFSKGITDGTYIYAVSPGVYGVCKIRCSDLALIDMVPVSSSPEGMYDAMKIGDVGYFSGGSGLIMSIDLPTFTLANEFHNLFDYSYKTITNIGSRIVVDEQAGFGYINTFNLSLVPQTWNKPYGVAGLITANGLAWGWGTGAGYVDYYALDSNGDLANSYNYPMAYYDYAFSSPIFTHSPSRVYDSTRNLAIFGYSTGFVKWVDMNNFRSGLVKLAWLEPMAPDSPAEILLEEPQIWNY